MDTYMYILYHTTANIREVFYTLDEMCSWLDVNFIAGMRCASINHYGELTDERASHFLL